MTSTPGRADQRRILDLTNPQRAARLEFEISPAHELVVALTAMSHTDSWDTYAYGVAWFDQLRSRMSDDLRARVCEPAAEGCYGKSWAHIVNLIDTAPRRDDVDAVIDHIAGLPAGTVYRALVEGSLGHAAHAQAAVVDAAVAGDADARRRVLDLAGGGDEDWARAALEALLRSDPETTHHGVLAGLREAREILRDHLDTILPVLHHDAERRRQLVRGLPLEEAVEVGTDGIHYQPEPGVRRIVLVPQAAMRPWVLICEHDDTKLFLVAVGDESMAVDLEAPPPRLLALTKALAEEQRLRILRRLATGPASLQQIADHLGVAKSTAHHHLVQLRAAGLTIVDIGADKEYTLRPGLVGDISQLLDTYLRAGSGRRAGLPTREGLR